MHCGTSIYQYNYYKTEICWKWVKHHKPINITSLIKTITVVTELGPTWTQLILILKVEIDHNLLLSETAILYVLLFKYILFAQMCKKG